MKFVLVPSSSIEMIWDKVEPLIDEATNLNNGLYTSEDVKNWILNNQRNLWVAYEGHKVFGVVVTGFNLESRKKILWVDICTGERLDEWIENIKTIEDWAKSNGCDRMWLMGRCGYEKKLKPLNYKKTHVFLEKDL